MARWTHLCCCLRWPSVCLQSVRQGVVWCWSVAYCFCLPKLPAGGQRALQNDESRTLCVLLLHRRGCTTGSSHGQQFCLFKPKEVSGGEWGLASCAGYHSLSRHAATGIIATLNTALLLCNRPICRCLSVAAWRAS